MEAFSWVDIFHVAVSSCLPCFSSNKSTNVSSSGTHDVPNSTGLAVLRIPSARPDELQGLLADPATDTDTGADALSMLSNPGRSRSGGKAKRKKMPAKKQIRLFGWDLFGRHGSSAGPIHLPESDDEFEEESDSSRRSLPPLRTGFSISSSTFDSDAAPLDSSTIEQISASAFSASRNREEEERLKAERRARRRERREQRRLSRMLDGAASAGGEFEGFQGSGDGIVERPHSPAVMEIIPPKIKGGSSEGEEDEADLGGDMYVREGSRGSYSDSRSRTSTSRSDRVAETSMTAKPITTTTTATTMLAPMPLTKSRKKLSSPSRSTTSGSTSQSPSLSSPTSTTFPPFAAFPHHYPGASNVILENFDGSQGLTLGDIPVSVVQKEQPGDHLVFDRRLPQTRLGPQRSDGFHVGKKTAPAR